MDSNNIVSHELKPPIWARYIRFHPKTWYSHISMRVEVYGCKKGTLYSASLMSLITSSTLKLLKFMGEIVSFFSIAICSLQVIFLQWVLYKNRKTIISLTIFVILSLFS